jgi:hypothetical protein
MHKNMGNTENKHFHIAVPPDKVQNNDTKKNITYASNFVKCANNCLYSNALLKEEELLLMKSKCVPPNKFTQSEMLLRWFLDVFGFNFSRDAYSLY